MSDQIYAFDFSFKDFILYTEKDIVAVNKEGILLNDGNLINFRLCAENFKEAHKNSIGKCIAERIAPTFIFYTKPKPTKLTFLHRNKIIELFSPTRNRVYALQRKIEQYGFRTWDLS